MGDNVVTTARNLQPGQTVLFRNNLWTVNSHKQVVNTRFVQLEHKAGQADSIDLTYDQRVPVING